MVWLVAFNLSICLSDEQSNSMAESGTSLTAALIATQVKVIQMDLKEILTLFLDSTLDKYSSASIVLFVPVNQ